MTGFGEIDRNEEKLVALMVVHEVNPGCHYKAAVKVIDLFENATMEIVEVGV